MFERSHRREQLVAAIIGVELSAALPADRGAAGGGRSVGGNAKRATQAVGAAAGLAGGKGGAGGADAEHQQGGGGNLDRQSHGRVLPSLDRDIVCFVHLTISLKRRVWTVANRPGPCIKTMHALHKRGPGGIRFLHKTRIISPRLQIFQDLKVCQIHLCQRIIRRSISPLMNWRWPRSRALS